MSGEVVLHVVWLGGCETLVKSTGMYFGSTYECDVLGHDVM